MIAKQAQPQFSGPRLRAPKPPVSIVSWWNFAKSGALLMLAGIMIATPTYAKPDANDTEIIEYLIHYVSESNMIFVRNFGKHDSKRAASHIRDKYDHFLDDIDSPEEFIELCASKSLVTGREYSVIDPEGKKLRSRDWLLSALDAYRAKQ